MLSDDQRDRLQRWALQVLPRAVAYARSLVQDPSRAEDLVQECLYRLLRRAERYDLEQDGIKLLFRSISNLCINQTTRERALHSLDATSEDGATMPMLDPQALRPEQIVQQRELEDHIRQAMQQLPSMQRAALELRALGMSKEQIGEVLDVSATNAGVLVYRARRELVQLLGPLLGEKE